MPVADRVSETSTMFPQIVCPIDRLPQTKSGEHLVCPNGHRWSIQQGIPRMVLERSNYADAFGLQWKTYRRTQLDSYTRTTISRDRVRRCLGEECWALLHGDRRINVLEVGCGAGRFTEILLDARAYVTSTDYSLAVEANQENFPQNDRHRIIQADIRMPPFALGQYDLVFCLGVIQHTPNPEETIAKLYGQVKPGGYLVLDHYTYNLSLLTKSALLLRPLLKRLRPDQGLRWTDRLVRAFLPLHRKVRHTRILQILLSRLSPVISYYQTYPQLNDQLQHEWALLDTHDSMTDYYKHLRTKGQIERTLRSLGATDIHCRYAGNGVEAHCRKPR